MGTPGCQLIDIPSSGLTMVSENFPFRGYSTCWSNECCSLMFLVLHVNLNPLLPILPTIFPTLTASTTPFQGQQQGPTRARGHFQTQARQTRTTFWARGKAFQLAPQRYFLSHLGLHVPVLAGRFWTLAFGFAPPPVQFRSPTKHSACHVFVTSRSVSTPSPPSLWLSGFQFLSLQSRYICVTISSNLLGSCSPTDSTWNHLSGKKRKTSWEVVHGKPEKGCWNPVLGIST